MQVIKYLQLPLHFDAPMLIQALDKLTNSKWLMHYQTLHYEGEWSAIPLRSLGGKADNIFIAATDEIAYEDTLFLSQAPYLQEVLATFKCPLKAVRLLKLHAGANIKEHRDAELNFENGEIRIHIPIITHERVDFYLDGEKMHLKPGECWYMNFNLPHNIQNNSPINRVHLVIDAVVNDWVKALFAEQGLIRKEIEEAGYDPETKLQIIAQLRSLNTETGNQLANTMEASLQINHTR